MALRGGAATTATPFDSFASQKELAELAAGWPAERLVAIWNSLPGATPVKVRWQNVDTHGARFRREKGDRFGL